LMRRQDQGGWHDCMRSKYGRQYTQGETSPSWGRRGRLVISPVSYTTRTFNTMFTWIRHWSVSYARWIQYSLKCSHDGA
jgi:hypothetical protein